MNRAGKTYAMRNGPVVFLVLSSHFEGQTDRSKRFWCHHVVTLDTASPGYSGRTTNVFEFTHHNFEAIYEEIGSLLSTTR